MSHRQSGTVSPGCARVSRGGRKLLVTRRHADRTRPSERRVDSASRRSDDEAAVPGNVTAGDARDLDDLHDAGVDQSVQLGVRRGAAHAAIDLQGNRPPFAEIKGGNQGRKSKGRNPANEIRGTIPTGLPSLHPGPVAWRSADSLALRGSHSPQHPAAVLRVHWSATESRRRRRGGSGRHCDLRHAHFAP